MNVLLLLAHSIEEYDQLRLMHELGYSVASIGGYIDPANPHDDKRPALPQVPKVDVVYDAVQEVAATPERPDRLWNAKDDLPDAIVAWADVIIVHHVEWRWIVGNWDKIRDKRVIWRTVGQSSHANEARMRRYRDDGLQVVRYSPKEKFLPNYVGHDAIIRFWKDPDEWNGWTGENTVVTNVTQNMVERGGFCNLEFYRHATRDLPAAPAGPGSEKLPGGLGEMTLDEMKTLLRQTRAYIYTGTQPASYTLGLIEAAMTGIPIVSIGPAWMHGLNYGSALFEGHEFAWEWSDSPQGVRRALQRLLDDYGLAREASAAQRQIALANFSRKKVGADWLDFLGAPTYPPGEEVHA